MAIGLASGPMSRKVVGKMKVRNGHWLVVLLSLAYCAKGEIATFEDLTLPPESYWNGADGSGGFHSGTAAFRNNYDSTWDSWDGFAYSNIADTATSGMAGQYHAVAGSGQGASANYAVGFVGWAEPPTVTLDTARSLCGLYVTNICYPYYAMRDGDAFSKKFGGDTGDEPDWFLLTITGKDNAGHATGTVDFYLADFRFDDNGLDYIVDTWQFVDLTSLGEVQSLEFGLSSSDVGAWGMNTPGYFAMDTLVGVSDYPCAGPYTEAGINGYVGSDGRHAGPDDDDAIVNPIFRGWATAVVSYNPAPGVDLQWSNPNKALGRVTGYGFDIVSLGDLNSEQIERSEEPGEITLSFSETICNGAGYDFTVFENGLFSRINTTGGSVAGQMFAELAYVEVSSNGQDFARFPAVSLTAAPVGSYGTIEISKVYNLAGKHPNAGGFCAGTPFDLQELAEDSDVVSGLVDINNIKYVRLVDIPGSGDFYDDAARHIDPGAWSSGTSYTNNHPIYDAWVTFGSSGFDVEAVGVLREQEYGGDINLDSAVDIHDFALFASAWRSHFGQANWLKRCDVAQPKDLIIDVRDLAVLAAQWLQVEQW